MSGRPRSPSLDDRRALASWPVVLLDEANPASLIRNCQSSVAPFEKQAPHLR
jgi:hypothetical protein